MKIALIGPSTIQKGGVASVLRVLTDYLQRNDIKVVSVTTTTPASNTIRLWIFLRALWTVVRTCLVGTCDVMHLHMASRGSCLRKSWLALVCLAFRKPYILHLHGGEFDEFFENELNLIGQHYVKFVFRRARYVIALSNTWRDWINSTIAGARVEVVSNGVETELGGSAEPTASKTILFLGKVGERKGMGELIEATRNITAFMPEVVVEIGGDGELDRYQREASDLPNVRFLGWIDESRRAEALHRACIFCLPSWSEGLPMSILEAMSAGLPVVSTRVGGIPEAVLDGRTGLLVAPRDVDALSKALLQILSNRELGVDMGLRGRALQRKKFSVEAMGSACVNLYRRCIND